MPKISYQRIDRRPGASPRDLKEFQRRFSYPLAAEYLEVLKENDGVIYWLAGHGKEVQFLSTVEVVEYYDAYMFERFMADALPFALDGNSNFLVLDGRAGSNHDPVFLIGAGNLCWEDAVLIAKDFRSFLGDPRSPETVSREMANQDAPVA